MYKSGYDDDLDAVAAAIALTKMNAVRLEWWAVPPAFTTEYVGVVTELVEGDVYHWGALMAGPLLGSLPVAIMYLFFVEYCVSGMTA